MGTGVRHLKRLEGVESYFSPDLNNYMICFKHFTYYIILGLFAGFSASAQPLPGAPGQALVTYTLREKGNEQVTEEAIINSLLAATTTKGRAGHIAEALPMDKVLPVLRNYNRIK